MTDILTRIGALLDDLSMPRNEHDVLSDAADEIARLRTMYASAYHGRGEFRDALRAQRKELAACRLRKERLREASELAVSEMSFTVHDIADPRRRKNDEVWSERRGASLAEAADRLEAALRATKKGIKAML